ncbi:hypothetical protein FOZ63_015945, partial [Perkinsus olseni]
LYAMRGLLIGAVATIPLVLCPDPYLRAALSAAFIARALDIAAMRLMMRLIRAGPCLTSNGDVDSAGALHSEGELPRWLPLWRPEEVIQSRIPLGEDMKSVCRTEEKPLDPSSCWALSRGELPPKWHTASFHQTSRRLGVLAAPTIERAVMYGGDQRGGSPIAKSVLRALVLSMALHLPPQLLRKSSIVGAPNRLDVISSVDIKMGKCVWCE